MTKGEIIAKLAERCGVTQAAARQFYEALNETVIEGLKSDQIVKIKGLGTFKTVTVKARKSVNINGGAEIEIPSHDKVSFTAEKTFADLVNEPLAHLEVVELSDETESKEMEREDMSEPKSESFDDNDYKMSMSMKKLGEDAEELKGLLAEINGTEAANMQNAGTDVDIVETEETAVAEKSKEAEPIRQEPANKPAEAEKPVMPEPRQEQPESRQYIYREEPAKEEKKITHGGLIGRAFLCVVLLLLVVAGVLYWIQFGNGEKREPQDEDKQIVTEQKTPEPDAAAEVVVENDPMREEPETGTTAEPVKSEPVKTALVKSEPAKSAHAASAATGKPTIEELRKIKVDYSQTKGTETVKEGSRLTMISLRAYGDKAFWIYIYLANRDNLSNPGEIKPGMVIKLPELDSRLTDKNNPESLKLAKELENKYSK